MKPFAIVLSRGGRGRRTQMVGANLANAQCECIQKCHNESPHATKMLFKKVQAYINIYVCIEA
jgi:hypothetical protein